MKHQLAFITLLYLLASCGGASNSENKTNEGNKSTNPENTNTSTDPAHNIGVGPIKEVQLVEIDPAMAEAGKTLFDTKCTACHKIDTRYIGPAIKGVIIRRNPVWIMNMMMAPDVMIKEDQIAKQLLGEANGAPMANQSLTEEQARQILEYFRQIQ